MHRPQFRFTLSNDTLGSQVISEPEGWNGIQINLERDPKFHSLIENFEVPLIFYGSNGFNDGGYSYIKNALALGIDEVVEMLVEIRYDSNDTFEVLFKGTVDLSTKKEIDFRKIQCAIIRNTNWAKFINRLSTPVNILSATTLDGEVKAAEVPITLPLKSQKIRTLYHAEMVPADITDAYSYLIEYNWDSSWFDGYAILDLPNVLADSVEERYTYFSETTQYKPTLETIYAKYAGTYTIDYEIYLSTSPYNYLMYTGGNYVNNMHLNLYVNGTKVAFANRTNLGTEGVDGRTKFKLEVTLELSVGDQVQVMFRKDYGYGLTPSTCFVVYNNFLANSNSYAKITADTIDEDTTGEVLQIGKVMQSIIHQIVGEDIIDSPFFLDNTECGYENVVCLGLHLRGYTMAEKEPSLSFEQIWDGIAPLYNLGLGYEDDVSPDSIYIGKKEDFYDPIPSLRLEKVNNIGVEFDADWYSKTIEIGFEKWAIESDQGIDDPQSKRMYRTRFKTFGQELQILSKFFAASSGIEQTRRNRSNSGEDSDIDEDVVIIATRNNAAEVELHDFGITGLLNSETRYNVRHTPARMLKRWLPHLSGQLHPSYPNEKFYFASGEGNVEMSWVGDTCDQDAVTENEDMALEPRYNVIPELMSFSHPLTYGEYLTIRNSRKKAIEISYIDRDGIEVVYLAYIKKLSWLINKSLGEFQCWFANTYAATTPTPYSPPASPPANFYYPVSATYNGEVSNNYTVDISTVQLTLTGTTSSDSDTLNTNDTSVIISVQKTSKATADRDVYINYKKNGVTVGTDIILKGDNIGLQGHTINNLVDGDVILVEILENYLVFDVRAYLTESVTSTVYYQVSFESFDAQGNAVGNTGPQLLTDNGASYVSTLQSTLNGFIKAYASKQVNTTEAGAAIMWEKNDQLVDAVYFYSPGASPNEFRTITGLEKDDVIDIEITES